MSFNKWSIQTILNTSDSERVRGWCCGGRGRWKEKIHDYKSSSVCHHMCAVLDINCMWNIDKRCVYDVYMKSMGCHFSVRVRRRKERKPYTLQDQIITIIINKIVCILCWAQVNKQTLFFFCFFFFTTKRNIFMCGVRLSLCSDAKTLNVLQLMILPYKTLL